jgi:tRNA dimethylallyltransferase
MGPTASGKTALALELAQHLPVEIISVDSAMVYRGMDIGTSKPSTAELASVPHHLIDIREPNEPYSAAAFVEDALQCMQDITERGRIPLLVGGTMLYFRALQQGLSPLPPADPIIREALLTEANTIGWSALHQRLSTVDPDSAKRIHQHDSQRIQRALEIYAVSQKPMSAFFKEPNQTFTAQSSWRGIEDYQIGTFALMPSDRKILHDNIEKRFDQMLAAGLVGELQKLYERGDLSPMLPSLRSVGYRQVWQYLKGECTLAEMRLKAIVATRQLAKRQITWLRGWSHLIWLQNTHLASVKTVLNCVSLGEFEYEPPIT